MRSTIRTALAATAVVGLLAIPVAATAADTTVSFTVASSGALAIDQGGVTTASLASGGNPLNFSVNNAGTVTGSLPETTITDNRGTLAGAWTVSVVATGDWLNQTDNSVKVARTNGRAYLDVADLPTLATTLSAVANGMLLTGAELTAGTSNLGTSYTLVSGTTTLGNGSLTYTPKVSVTVPAATPAGTYQAVVRQTIG